MANEFKAGSIFGELTLSVEAFRKSAAEITNQARAMVSRVTKVLSSTAPEKAIIDGDAVAGQLTRVQRAAASFGKSFRASIRVAQASMSTFLSVLRSIGRLATRVFRGVTQAVRRLIPSFRNLFSVANILRGALIGLAGVKLVTTSNEAEAIARGFQELSTSIGAVADSLLNKLRRATRGTVSDLELMRAANNAVLLGVIRSEDEFAELTSAARRLGRAVGRGPVDALNDLVVGIGRQSRLILDNLGLIVQVEAANIAYAASIGKTVDELTDFERRQAFFAAAADAIRKRIAQLGPDAELTADAWQRLGATIANTFGQISLAINNSDIPDALNDLVNGAQQAVVVAAKFIGGTISDLVRRIRQVIADLSSGELDPGDFLNQIKTVIVALANAIFSIVVRAGAGLFRSLVAPIYTAAKGWIERVALQIAEAITVVVDSLITDVKATAKEGLAAIVEAFNPGSVRAASLRADAEWERVQLSQRLTLLAVETQERVAAAEERIRNSMGEFGEGIELAIDDVIDVASVQFDLFRRTLDEEGGVFGEFADDLERRWEEARAALKETRDAAQEEGLSTSEAIEQLFRRQAQAVNPQQLLQAEEEFRQAIRDVRDEIADVEFDTLTLRSTDAERALFDLQTRFEAIAQTGNLSREQLAALAERYGVLSDRVREYYEELARLEDAQRLRQTAVDIGGSVLDGLRQAVAQGQDAGDALAQTMGAALSRELDKSFEGALEAFGRGFESVLTQIIPGLQGQLSGLVSGVLGAAGLALQALDQKASAVVDGFEDQVQSSEAIRGVVVGPTSIPIAQIGDALGVALRGTENLLAQILQTLQRSSGVRSSVDGTSRGVGVAPRLTPTTL